jgi:acid phosphatase (class A)
MMSDLVKPLLEPKTSGAYPSGHATVGTLMGIILSDMVPEKRAEIMARAAEFAHNRVVAGMHVPSDIDAGKIAGSVIAAQIMGQDDFKAEYADAKAELRAALGL